MSMLGDLQRDSDDENYTLEDRDALWDAEAAAWEPNVEVVKRAEGAWVCRCTCEWVTFNFDTRQEAREARWTHLWSEHGVAA